MLKKVIIIDENYHKKKKRIHRFIGNRFVNWLLYMIGYAFILILVSCLFQETFYIDYSYYGIYAFVSAVIIYVLNQTVKPVLFYITLPITAISMGLFYPIINVLILYITSYILGSHFSIHGIVLPFVIAIFISVLNLFMEGMIIKPIIDKGRDYNE